MVTSNPSEIASLLLEISYIPFNRRPLLSLELDIGHQKLLFERVRLCEGQLNEPIVYGVYFYPDVKMSQEDPLYSNIPIYVSEEEMYFQARLDVVPKITKLYVHWIFR